MGSYNYEVTLLSHTPPLHISSSQSHLYTCPACETDHLYLSYVQGGALYRCVRCEIRGFISTLSSNTSLASSYPSPPRVCGPRRMVVEGWVEELRRRGISWEVQSYSGVYPGKVHQRPSIILPFSMSRNGRWIARTLDGRDPKYLCGDVPLGVYLHDRGAIPGYWDRGPKDPKGPSTYMYIYRGGCTQKDTPPVYVVESALDVLVWLSWCDRLGAQRTFRRVVALNGCNITRDMQAWLGGRRLLLALDQDEAGQAATARILGNFSRAAVLKVGGHSPGEWTEEVWKEVFRC